MHRCRNYVAMRGGHASSGGLPRSFGVEVYRDFRRVYVLKGWNKAQGEKFPVNPSTHVHFSQPLRRVSLCVADHGLHWEEAESQEPGRRPFVSAYCPTIGSGFARQHA